MPSYPHTLPPIAPGPQNLSVVQNQLAETQASLTTHSDRVKSLEETITSLKEEVERTKTEMGLLLATKPHQNGPTTNGSRFNEDEDAQSDAVSIASTDTVRYMTEDDDRALRDEQDNLRAVNATLLTRIEELSGELRQANSISSTLSEQHKSQADLLSGMQERLTKLEDNTSSSSASASLDGPLI